MEHQVYYGVKSNLSRAIGRSPPLLSSLRQEHLPSELVQRRKFLVACHEIAIAGGLFRFERFGRVVARSGHQVAFLAFGESPQQMRTTDFPVLTMDEADGEVWDATFVPGAGFPDETIAAFSKLKRPSFGVRIQHILNDKSQRPNFLNVNRSFEPHVVVFNNRRWGPEDFADFQAQAHHFLEGAVDLVQFSPDPGRRAPQEGAPFVVGALAAKNAEPLIEAIRRCDFLVRLHLYGPSQGVEGKARDLIADGRLQLWGILRERELADFYASVDCVVHTEQIGGWSNLVAEAMACGLPVICTPHGTGAFAENEETALIVADPDPDVLAASINRVRNDRRLATKLAHNARARICSYPWTSYSEKLLRIVEMSYQNPSHG